MFEKVLIANRGAVAARVLRSLRALGIRSVAVYSEADAAAPYLEEADETFAIGPAHPRESYLNQDALIAVLRQSGADAVHPGYGFLAENPDFAERVAAAGATFIGPSPRWISAMGHMTRARDLVARHGLTIGGGSRVLAMADDPVAEARKLGFPVLIKPAAGGGGIGMLPARDEEELVKAIKRARSMAERGFGNGEVYLERLVDRPRHIEFQILGDKHGDACHIFERDCSVQRRHQKIIEEAPAPGLPRDFAEGLADRIAGTMHRDWRLDMAAPYVLERAQSRGEGLLVTKSTDGATGVEMREAAVDLGAGVRVVRGGALPVAGWFQLAESMRAAGREPDIRAVILRAEGKGFQAGVDIKELAADPTHASLVGVNRGCYEAFAAVYECEVPVIAAVQGFCLGGGLGLAGNADIVVASEDATFGLPEVDRGALGFDRRTLHHAVGRQEQRGRGRLEHAQIEQPREARGLRAPPKVVVHFADDGVGRDRGESLLLLGRDLRLGLGGRLDRLWLRRWPCSGGFRGGSLHERAQPASRRERRRRERAQRSSQLGEVGVTVQRHLDGFQVS